MSAFDNKSAIVTGAGRGIGAGVARMLAARGARVGLVDIDTANLERVRRSIEDAGGSAVIATADVTSEDQVRSAIDSLADRLGGLDMLAAFAGIVGYAAAPDTDAEAWDRIMNTNARGAFLCVKHAIPHLRDRGGGSIVLTSSIMAFATEKAAGVYSASKAAVAALTNTLALDHAEEGIRVNALVPGVIRTELLEDAAQALAEPGQDPSELVESWGRRQPIGRSIDPDEVAEVALFLLSDAASAVTGSCYRVDGGLLSRLG
ncbi:SDR family NAD(P)-dependent oxidoreductase [Kribbella sp. NPDC048915]|uniref:SDR family NAD(P)-dependent oxidoreductase n=1 Tax=Kribbella sp. NPDC048915 TaxID=3155148 RepID=UPI0033E2DC19